VTAPVTVASSAGPRRALRGGAALVAHAVPPSLSALAPLAVLPAVSTTSGPTGWAALALGMSLGGAVAVVAELGWCVTGPQQVAREPRHATALLASSLATRALALLLLMPAAVVLASSLGEEHHGASAWAAAGAALSALSPAWFLTGHGRPWTLVLLETVPRCVALGAAALVILAGGPLEAYGQALAASAVVTCFAAGLVARIGSRDLVHAVRTCGPVLRSQSVTALGRAASVVSTTLPATALTLVAPGAVPAFAAADRLTRAGLSVLAAVPARAQRWLGVATPRDRRRRCLVLMVGNAVLGAGAGTCAALLLSVVVDVLFVGTVDVPLPLAVAEGALVAVICTSRAAGLALVAVGEAASITTASCAAAVVAVIAVPTGGALAGAAGAALGVLLAETVALVVQVRRWHRVAAARPEIAP